MSARILYFLLLTGLLYGIYRFVEQRKRLLQERKERAELLARAKEKEKELLSDNEYLAGQLRLQCFQDIPIGVIKVFPGIQFSLFESIMTEKLKGIVIETFGTGNIPGSGDALLPIIRRAYQHGTVLTVCSQCLQGTVSLGTYETSSALKNAGAVSGLDMTTEAAVAKLYYLFSCGYNVNTIKDMMGHSLRGEISGGKSA